MRLSPQGSGTPRTRWRLTLTVGSLLTALALATAPSVANATTTGPPSGRVPKGFAATSVTFTSQSEAYVLGTAPCAHKPCTSIVRTLDRGAQWKGIPAPVVPIGSPYGAAGAAIWGIRFGTPLLGFVFGDGLWETTDGGAHWSQVTFPGTSVLSLATIDGQVLALTRPCTPATCNTDAGTLYRRALSGGGWHKVATVALGGNGPDDLISTQANVAAVQDGNSVLVTSNGGVSVTRRGLKCGPSDVGGPADVAATGPHSLAELCSGSAGAGSVAKSLYVSSDLGAHWTRAGTPPTPGDPAHRLTGIRLRLLHSKLRHTVHNPLKALRTD